MFKVVFLLFLAAAVANKYAPQPAPEQPAGGDEGDEVCEFNAKPEGANWADCEKLARKLHGGVLDCVTSACNDAREVWVRFCLQPKPVSDVEACFKERTRDIKADGSHSKEEKLSKCEAVIPDQCQQQLKVCKPKPKPAELPAPQPGPVEEGDEVCTYTAKPLANSLEECEQLARKVNGGVLNCFTTACNDARTLWNQFCLNPQPVADVKACYNDRTRDIKKDEHHSREEKLDKCKAVIPDQCQQQLKVCKRVPKPVPPPVVPPPQPPVVPPPQPPVVPPPQPPVVPPPQPPVVPPPQPPVVPPPQPPVVPPPQPPVIVQAPPQPPVIVQAPPPQVNVIQGPPPPPVQFDVPVFVPKPEYVQVLTRFEIPKEVIVVKKVEKERPCEPVPPTPDVEVDVNLPQVHLKGGRQLGYELDALDRALENLNFALQLKGKKRAAGKCGLKVYQTAKKAFAWPKVVQVKKSKLVKRRRSGDCKDKKVVVVHHHQAPAGAKEGHWEWKSDAKVVQDNFAWLGIQKPAAVVERSVEYWKALCRKNPNNDEACDPVVRKKLALKRADQQAKARKRAEAAALVEALDAELQSAAKERIYLQVELREAKKNGTFFKRVDLKVKYNRILREINDLEEQLTTARQAAGSL